MNGLDPAADTPDPADEVVDVDDLLDDLADPDADLDAPDADLADPHQDTPDPGGDIASAEELPTFGDAVDDVCDPRPNHRPKRLSRGGFIEKFCRVHFGARGPE